MNGRVAAVIGLMVAAGAVLFALTLGDAPVPKSAGTAGAGRELLAALDRGEAATAHATYLVNLAGAPPGTTVVIERWRRGDRARQDTTLDSLVQKSSTSLFRLPTGAVLCSTRGEEAPTCQPAQQTPRSAVDVLLGDLRADLGSAEVSVAEEDVSGRPARCYTIPEGDRPAKACVLADGVPALIATSQGTMILTGVDDVIPDSIFTPPA